MALRVKRKVELRSETLTAALRALGCPLFPLPAQDEKLDKNDPAVVLLAAVSCEELESRVLLALPWLALEFADMDWEWAITEARRRQSQNRLGYIVTLAQQLGARQAGNEWRLARLATIEEALFEVRLEEEQTLCQDSLPESERRWLRESRPREARFWNLLTSIQVEDLPLCW